MGRNETNLHTNSEKNINSKSLVSSEKYAVLYMVIIEEGVINKSSPPHLDSQNSLFSLKIYFSIIALIIRYCPFYTLEVEKYSPLLSTPWRVTAYSKTH